PSHSFSPIPPRAPTSPLFPYTTLFRSYPKRFLHYLTADELLGDIMRTTLRADQTLVAYPPLRGYLDAPSGVPTVIRIGPDWYALDRKSTRLNSSHVSISYAVFCLKKKT